MKKTKKIIRLEKENSVLICTYICPNTDKETFSSIYRIDAHESACECCGSHGEKSIELDQCPECGYNHIISWDSW